MIVGRTGTSRNRIAQSCGSFADQKSQRVNAVDRRSALIEINGERKLVVEIEVLFEAVDPADYRDPFVEEFFDDEDDQDEYDPLNDPDLPGWGTAPFFRLSHNWMIVNGEAIYIDE